MHQRIATYRSLYPKPEPPIESYNVPSDPRGAGMCAFASRDIKKGEIICEYEGEVISLQEADWREKLYEAEGRPCTLMVIESAGHNVAIDPYEGDPTRQLTWGATLNHSRNNANVKPFVIDKNSDNPRAFFVDLHDVAETTELLWDYNDPDWMCYSSSQTLPQNTSWNWSINIKTCNDNKNSILQKH